MEVGHWNAESSSLLTTRGRIPVTILLLMERSKNMPFAVILFSPKFSFPAKLNKEQKHFQENNPALSFSLIASLFRFPFSLPFALSSLHLATFGSFSLSFYSICLLYSTTTFCLRLSVAFSLHSSLILSFYFPLYFFSLFLYLRMSHYLNMYFSLYYFRLFLPFRTSVTFLLSHSYSPYLQ